MSPVYLLPAVWTRGCFCLSQFFEAVRGTKCVTGRGSGGGLGQGDALPQPMGHGGVQLPHLPQEAAPGRGLVAVITVFQANTMAEKIKNHPLISFQCLVFLRN